MTDEDLGAPAPEPVADSAPSPSTGEALERAFRSQGLTGEAPAEAPEGEDAPAEAKESPARGPDGKFAPKAPEAEAAPEKPAEQPAEAPKGDAPSRFSPDAKAEWEKTPAPVRAEVSRAFRELEGGIERYRQQVEPLRPFIDMAQKSGTTIDQALSRYVGLEQMIAKDPIAGLDQVCKNLGMSLRDVAAHVMGQPAQGNEGEVARLQQEIAALKQQVGGVSTTIEQQREREVLQQVEQFAAQPGRERFEELSDAIAQLITAGIAKGLDDGYEMAARLNPAAAPASPPPPAAQTREAPSRKAHISVQGAPSGSNPASRQRSASTDEALQRAFGAVGL